MSERERDHERFCIYDYITYVQVKYIVKCRLKPPTALLQTPLLAKAVKSLALHGLTQKFHLYIL